MAARKPSNDSPQKIPQALLAWYDENARALPWRSGPHAKAGSSDPYAVWLSEIMLQQTTVATVAPRFREFLARWPTVKALAAAEQDAVLGAWAGLGYYARARNLHRCARAVANDHGGVFPDTEEGLRALPGIGHYTAAAIAAIAFDRPAVAVDGNIERVAARLFAIDAPLPQAKAELKAAIGSIWPQKRSGDFAQALMDLGAIVCTPRAPKCLLCPISKYCEARAKGIAESLPKKAKNPAKPTRYGAAFALFNAKGEVLVERRPEKGLLGGMLGLPTTDWTESKASAVSPVAPNAKWKRAGLVEHAFTHFHLKLETYVANGNARHAPRDGDGWARPETVRLPTVMKKALALATDSSK